jgi:hypothetical protein
MGEWLDKQFAIRNAECPDCEYVLFWHKADAKMGKAGTKLDTFPASWDRAIGQAGFETDGKDKLIPHDLRRSACRNLARVLPQGPFLFYGTVKHELVNIRPPNVWLVAKHPLWKFLVLVCRGGRPSGATQVELKIDGVYFCCDTCTNSTQRVLTTTPSAF